MKNYILFFCFVVESESEPEMQKLKEKLQKHDKNCLVKIQEINLTNLS